ncbi:mediator of RNA polymerase II transcription subunit 8 isoform X2 [Bombus vosnesenskii]|uniref:Mediator of RNA polymerase II transcription subunit 8 n=3 Tax=Pyrobombus TaxID=144703 RepID=A0A6J3K010_9HYME|nr:mediator of RNA polymerase II transcription subunit 8 isoform X2 [Bombus impatiens]XP_033206811.1 mediator of RNA polymerase II transcription subunit 8 isoform X2 [Bombus vancouverensis nearcticus]XP_033314095.1 mediator of RNA polymerase II transcription subunit 8 isoform X2 [Bombus bifarius]XP_033345644.1 mediator of RNA polymerase II transcription subunit 8 isoform X2 [Bombus vosnesenskii]XP_050470935.1 mediator of RNA polymerase II transcription subunit 8 [Bombus huntii]
MQREEKQLDSALEAIIMRVNDLKTAIAAMIFKLEHEYETLNWPNFLDNFALISGHLTSLSKILGHDKAPNLRNLTVLPLRLSPEKDEELLRLTEGRIPTFAHDLVPDYLRTKVEPQAEQKMMQLETKAANVNFEASHKHMGQYTKVINNIWDVANKAREEWESEAGSRATQAQTSSTADTHALVAAVGMGKGLKSDSVQMVQSGVNSVPSGMMVGRPGNQQQAPGQGSLGNPSMGQMSKAPSAIKTNIKAASQIHPYR